MAPSDFYFNESKKKMSSNCLNYGYEYVNSSNHAEAFMDMNFNLLIVKM